MLVDSASHLHCKHTFTMGVSIVIPAPPGLEMQAISPAKCQWTSLFASIWRIGTFNFLPVDTDDEFGNNSQSENPNGFYT